MRFSWGTLLESAEGAVHRPASYDWNGARYVWDPKMAPRGHAALDVERLDTPPSDLSLAPSLSHRDFLHAWTRLEVLAKLADEPILARLRRDALVIPPLNTGYRHTDSAGATFLLHSGVWTERQLVFTCGYRVA